MIWILASILIMILVNKITDLAMPTQSMDNTTNIFTYFLGAASEMNECRAWRLRLWLWFLLATALVG